MRETEHSGLFRRSDGQGRGNRREITHYPVYQQSNVHMSRYSPQQNGLLYEVNIRVLEEIAEAYESWLDDHIRELLAIDGFEAADWFEIEEDTEAQKIEEALRQAVRLDESIPVEIREAASNPVRTRLYCVQYRLRDADAFENYVRNHADRMRQQGIDRFGSKFAATRRIMTLRESYH